MIIVRTKRKSRRFFKRCNVEFTVSNIKFRGISSDFSLTGFFLRTTHPQFAGTVLDVVIERPDGQICRVKGEVTRSVRSASRWYGGRKIRMTSEKDGMGIRVIEKDQNYLHLIRDLLVEQKAVT